MSKHIHKYKRIFLSKKKGIKGYPVWRCMLADCSHYMAGETVVGRKSVCWKCGDSFTLTKFSLERVKPTCDTCRGIELPEVQAENKENLDNITSTIEDMIESLNLGFNK